MIPSPMFGNRSGVRNSFGWRGQYGAGAGLLADGLPCRTGTAVRISLVKADQPLKHGVRGITFPEDGGVFRQNGAMAVGRRIASLAGST